MKATARHYDGTRTEIDVRFDKQTTDFGDEYHYVYVDDEKVGRVEKTESRTPVYGGGSRVAVGYRIRKGWKARATDPQRTRYATVQTSRLAAVADLLDGVATVTKAAR